MVSSILISVAVSALPVKFPADNCPLIVKFPDITVLPVADATVNLSVVPSLTAKFASTSTVPLNSVVPVLTVKLPPMVVLPSSVAPDPVTLNVPVDCMSIPRPFLNCRSPAPSFHVEPDALPPVIAKLPVSVSPNFAHAAPVQYHPR